MRLVPPSVKALVPYKAGRSIEEVVREFGVSRVVKLASNENPLGPSPLAIQAAQEALEQAHRYPDPASYTLSCKLAKRYNVKPDNIVIGNGSESIMATAMRTFLMPHDEIIAPADTFAGFRVLASASGNKTHWIARKKYRHDLPAMAAAINEYTKLIYLANPDNPIGCYATTSEFEDFVKSVPPHVLVLIDEAYFEFACHLADYPDSMRYRLDNVITLRTFSKAHGLAGLRVGYGIAHEALIASLRKMRLPFEPSVPAQAAALAALGDDEHLQNTLANNEKGAAQLLDGLRKLGVEALDTAANFVAMQFDTQQRAAAVTDALQRKGVIVRHIVTFGWPSMIRVSIGLAEENEIFLNELQQVLRSI